MAKQVLVTTAQRDAARIIVKRSEAKGKDVSSEIRKIAEAPAGKPIRVVVPTSKLTAGGGKSMSMTRSGRSKGGKSSAVTSGLRKMGLRSK